MSDGPGGPSPADDEIERRLRELHEEILGTPRNRGRSAPRSERTGPQSPPPGSRRRGGRTVGWLVAVVVLAGAGLFAWHQESRSGVGGPNDTQVMTNGAVPRTSAPVTSAPETSTPSLAATPYSGPPADPFAGTPAEHWADGAGTGT
jgi:hypothetical protein